MEVHHPDGHVVESGLYGFKNCSAREIFNCNLGSWIRNVHVFPLLLRPPQINFSVEKEWVSDSVAQMVLTNYRLFVIRLNMRGCTSLEWPSFQCICECPPTPPSSSTSIHASTETILLLLKHHKSYTTLYLE